ncbi:DUF4129 domain-containing protein [Cellulomonas sp. P22]|uniref:DUF4129 domain-containing protein n=1 Tax=Cellulomonas sp. P22 TaxID=3373189 RepID=UPI0037B82735
MVTRTDPADIARHDPTPRALPGRELLVAVLVGAGVLAAAVAGPWQLGRREATTGIVPAPRFSSIPQPSPEQVVPEPRLDAVDTSWSGWLAIGVAVALVVLLALLVRSVGRWWRTREKPEPDDDVAPDVALEADAAELSTPALREGVTRAARELVDGVPPGDAVVAAWVSLEQAAERSGLVRERAQTASEFTVEVLDSTRADPRATRTLLGLYLTARFSEHPVTAADVGRARECLATLADGLAARRKDDDAQGGGAS